MCARAGPTPTRYVAWILAAGSVSSSSTAAPGKAVATCFPCALADRPCIARPQESIYSLLPEKQVVMEKVRPQSPSASRRTLSCAPKLPVEAPSRRGALCAARLFSCAETRSFRAPRSPRCTARSTRACARPRARRSAPRATRTTAASTTLAAALTVRCAVSAPVHLSACGPACRQGGPPVSHHVRVYGCVVYVWVLCSGPFAAQALPVAQAEAQPGHDGRCAGRALGPFGLPAQEHRHDVAAPAGQLQVRGRG